VRDECCVLCAVEVTKGSAMGRQRAMLGRTQERETHTEQGVVVVKMIPSAIRFVILISFEGWVLHAPCLFPFLLEATR
jgi:hypothetical protein